VVALKLHVTAYFLVFFLPFFLIHYAIDVDALVSCLFIVMCCLFIVIVENADDDPDETKPIFVENSGDVKPLKVEAKRYMLTQMSSHLIPTKLNRKIWMICLIGYIVIARFPLGLFYLLLYLFNCLFVCLTWD